MLNQGNHKMYVYALVANEIPFYIGISKNPEARFRTHKYRSKNTAVGMPQTFSMEILDEVDYSQWEFWEKHYISLYKTWGIKLLNKSDGGDIIIKSQNPKPKKKKSTIKIYTKCENCGFMSEVVKKQRFCSRRCRDKFNYTPRPKTPAE